MKCSIAIVGGGIIGSAAAFFISRTIGAEQVIVLEPDPSYARATTPQGAGGVRQQFSVAENVAMSRYSLDFYKSFSMRLSGVPDLPDISFREQGYLFLVTQDGEKTLRHNQALQSAMGVKAELMDYAELRRRFPSIERGNIVLACYTPDDGWIDPAAALWGFRRAAQHSGAKYVQSKVVGIECDSNKVRLLRLENGAKVEADFFINAAGPWVAPIAQLTGATLPVVPMCRVQHFWKCAHQIEALPLIKDESGLFFRPEGHGFAGGRPSFQIKPGFIEDIHSGYFANYFEDVIWPMLAALVPKFETIRLHRSWAGHYAQNTLDGNMIIGKYSPGHDNIITACGFSGHGIMHAPAVGRALCELALTGRYQTLDLSRFEIGRVRRNDPLAEVGIR
ncbi:MAG: NAD(P)/FAD-dependent oxidoreductase [Hyphomicrobiaceae bacterium]